VVGRTDTEKSAGFSHSADHLSVSDPYRWWADADFGAAGKGLRQEPAGVHWRMKNLEIL
jgi:hypothetical protein